MRLRSTHLDLASIHLENSGVGSWPSVPCNRFTDMDAWKNHPLGTLPGVTVRHEGIFFPGNRFSLSIPGFDVPVNYDDVGLNCGGLSIQRANGKEQPNWSDAPLDSCLGGKCGVCGDAYTGPKYHEIGGKYATNVIVRQYATGAMIDVKILVRRLVRLRRESPSLCMT